MKKFINFPTLVNLFSHRTKFTGLLFFLLFSLLQLLCIPVITKYAPNLTLKWIMYQSITGVLSLTEFGASNVIGARLASRFIADSKFDTKLFYNGLFFTLLLILVSFTIFFLPLSIFFELSKDLEPKVILVAFINFLVTIIINYISIVYKFEGKYLKYLSLINILRSFDLLIVLLIVILLKSIVFSLMFSLVFKLIILAKIKNILNTYTFDRDYLRINFIYFKKLVVEFIAQFMNNLYNNNILNLLVLVISILYNEIVVVQFVFVRSILSACKLLFAYINSSIEVDLLKQAIHTDGKAMIAKIHKYILFYFLVAVTIIVLLIVILPILAAYYNINYRDINTIWVGIFGTYLIVTVLNSFIFNYFFVLTSQYIVSKNIFIAVLLFLIGFLLVKIYKLNFNYLMIMLLVGEIILFLLNYRSIYKKNSHANSLLSFK